MTDSIKNNQGTYALLKHIWVSWVCQESLQTLPRPKSVKEVNVNMLNNQAT